MDGEMVHRFAHVHGGAPDGRRGCQGRKGAHGQGSGGIDFFLLGFVAQAQEQIGNRDINGADFVAGTAEGGCLGEIGEFGDAVAKKDRRKHGTNGATVGRAIGVARRLAIDRANVLTGTAADAAENFAALRFQYFRATIVHEHHVHVSGARGLAGRLGTFDKFRVNGELLTRGRST